MPELQLLAVTITPVAQEEVSVPIHMDVANPDGAEITITPDVTATNAGTAPSLRGGVTVSVDLGSGTLTPIPMADLGASVSIQESLEGGNYSDVLTFSRVGASWSPFMQRLIGSRQRVAVDFTYGAPGFETTQRIFTGYFTGSSFQGNPPVATITALDDAILFSELTLSIHEEPGHGKTRFQILQQIATQFSIPLGAVDLGPNGDTVLAKPIDEAEAKPLEWLADFLSPCGVRLYFSDGKLNAIRHTTNPSSRRLTAADLVGYGFSLDMPAVAEANVVTSVAVKFTTTFANGLRTEVQVVSTFADYGEQRWVESQSTGGTITTGGPGAASETYQEIGRVTTTTTFYGATPIEQVVKEMEWYAPMSARRNINNSSGTITYNTAWKFPDGTWRSEQTETFRLIRKTHQVSSYDTTTLRIFEVDQYQYGYKNPMKAIWEVASGGDVPANNTIDDIPIDEDGIGHVYATEIFGSNHPDVTVSADAYNIMARTIQTRDVQTDGTVPLDTYTTYGYSAGAEAADAIGAYVYDTGRTIFRTELFEDYQLLQTRTVTSSLVGTDRVTVIDSTDIGETTITTQYGTLPYADAIQPESTSQEMRYTVTDEVRSVLNGERVEPIHNEWCENEDELYTVALTRLRELGAWSVPWTMPIEGLLHKGKWVTVNVPEIGIDEEQFLITGLTRDFGSFTQALSLKFYPPELAE